MTILRTLISALALTALIAPSGASAQCTACPDSDFSISPTQSWQTASSSIASNGCKVYAVAVTSGMSYTFKTGCYDGASANFDTYLELYDGSCSILAYNDDACEEWRSQLDWTATFTGTVYVRVRGYSSAFGDYTMAYQSCDVSAVFEYLLNGTEVTFTVSSLQAGATYTWDFGDGQYGSGPVVTHDFPCGYGSYVQLTATAASGCSVSSSAYVEPEGGLSVSFTFEQSGSLISFASEASVSGLEYFWDFGDGSTSDLADPVHEFGCAGEYWIYLQVYDPVNACYAYNYGLVLIEGEQLLPTFTYSVNGSTVSFTAVAEGAVSYYWYFGNGDYSTEQNPTYSYTCGGQYYVSLEVSDADGCQGYFYDIVNVEGLVLSADFTQSVSGSTVTFNGPSQGINSWEWYFGDGETAYVQNPVHTYSCPGTFYVSLQVYNDLGCSAYYYAPVQVGDASDSFSFVQSGSTVTFSGPSAGVVSWYWDFGTGAVSYQQNPVYTFSGCGIYYVTLYVQLMDGCESAFTQAVPVTGTLHVDAWGNGPLCPGATISLSSPGVQFGSQLWSGPNGFTSDLPNTTIPNATEAMSGTYQLTVFDVNGCPNIATVDVLVDVPPTTVQQTGAVLQATPGMASYYWTNCATGLSIPAQTGASFAPSANGSYSVTLTNSTGCTATSSCIQVTNVGVEESDPQAWGIRPNPSHGIFTIGHTGPMRWVVLDAVGREVASGSRTEVDLTGFPSGLYTLSVVTDGGVSAHRLVKL